jgi:threonine/homoserine/homoserine lactone efflux protein
VAGCLLVLSRFSDVNAVLGGISIVGGLYVLWLGVESLRIREVAIAESGAAAHSVRKAFGINILNPHAYLFWATVGAPTVLRAAKDGLANAVAFVVCFYILLCGSKMLLAVLIHRSRGFLSGKAYLRTLQTLGVVLLTFGVWLIREGYRYLSA